MNDATSTLSANARSDAAVATDTAPLPAAQAARVSPSPGPRRGWCSR
jgi:hypothetical protein